MVDRFDLEQHIMSCWNVCEDIKVVYRQYDYSSPSEDEMMNLLIGLEQLYQLKFQQLFDTFETLIRERKIV